jgi:hypothetical protein
MSVNEGFKRSLESLYIHFLRLKYSNRAKCRYAHFAGSEFELKFHVLPSALLPRDWKHYRIYDFEFDLTQLPDWYFTHNDSELRWPQHHFSRINYRPGNPHGDVRFNWELNRLQFLPTLAVSDAPLARRLISDWSEKNPFLHGPGYLASMEVALRWISIYWTACLLGDSLNSGLQQTLTGLAIASGNYIENRLSTHSSAGNHLIVETVGLFWLGKALDKYKHASRWIKKARAILGQQVVRQISADGSGREQSFWYLGFVVDALLHYLLLEDRKKISDDVWLRIEKALGFIHDLTLPDGSFPDFGDRDDGVVFRCDDRYGETPFGGLLNIGAHFFNRPEWFRNGGIAKERLQFWQNDQSANFNAFSQFLSRKSSNSPQLKIYPNGVQWRTAHSKLFSFNHCP